MARSRGPGPTGPPPGGGRPPRAVPVVGSALFPPGPSAPAAEQVSGPDPAAALLRQELALTIATQALTQQVAQLTGVVSPAVAKFLAGDFAPAGAGGRPPQSPAATPPPPAGGGLAGMLGGGATGFFTSIAARVAAPLAPLALFAQTLSNATSGLAPFLTSVKLATTVLSGFLMPAFVAAAGFTYALALAMDQVLTPSLESFATETLKNAAAEIDLFGKSVDGVKDSLKALGLKSDDLEKKFGAMMFPLGVLLNLLDKLPGMHGNGGRTLLPLVNPLAGGVVGAAPGAAPHKTVREYEEEEVERRRKEQGTAPGGAGSAGRREDSRSFLQNAIQGMRFAIQETQRSLGRPAQFQSLTQANRQLTLGALNASPFEREMLRIQTKQLEALERAVDKLRDPTTY